MKLKVEQNGHAFFDCPGCNQTHSIEINLMGWKWNGSVTKPTLYPSVLVRSGHHAPEWNNTKRCWCTYWAEHPEEKPVFTCNRCHSFITDGRIQFLADSSHALAGQTVDLPEYPE